MLGEVVLDICARAGVENADVSALTGALSGYVVDSPSSARAALEPLMAAHDFVAAERDGDVIFFHRDEGEPVAIERGAFEAASAGDAFAQRADSAEMPVEARVRFLDSAKDYLIAGVSARRLDRAEGGVISLDAPLVIETEAAEAIALSVLADKRAAAESLSIDVGPGHLALEPGDRITLAGGSDVFEIGRIEDVGARRMELRRARSANAAQTHVGEPSAPSIPAIAPTPAFSILDLPPLPGAEDDERPLVAVFASPWLGDHTVHAGAARTLRARVPQPAIVGELLWALHPGPVDRWDDGNIIRVKLYGGALASATADAVLDGANAFAIENNGEFEIIQARNCELVAPNEYQLSGFLRGRLGSAHATASPHPVGARIVKLDTRLGRANISAHEWREDLAFFAPPAGAPATDARAAEDVLALPHAALRPWAPAHLRAERIAGNDVSITWVRCARRGGDAWGPGEPPVGAPVERYCLAILDGATVKRTVDSVAPSFLYVAADQTADFGALPGSLRIRVAQVDEFGEPGLNKELTITL